MFKLEQRITFEDNFPEASQFPPPPLHIIKMQMRNSHGSSEEPNDTY